MKQPKRPKKMWCKDRNGLPYPSKAHIQWNWRMALWQMLEGRKKLAQLQAIGRVKFVVVNSSWPGKGKVDA